MGPPSARRGAVVDHRVFDLSMWLLPRDPADDTGSGDALLGDSFVLHRAALGAMPLHERRQLAEFVPITLIDEVLVATGRVQQRPAEVLIFLGLRVTPVCKIRGKALDVPDGDSGPKQQQHHRSERHGEDRGCDVPERVTAPSPASSHSMPITPAWCRASGEHDGPLLLG
jgi:hypothetical protein